MSDQSLERYQVFTSPRVFVSSDNHCALILFERPSSVGLQQNSKQSFVIESALVGADRLGLAAPGRDNGC
jgi:hypothetical protein